MKLWLASLAIIMFLIACGDGGPEPCTGNRALEMTGAPEDWVYDPDATADIIESQGGPLYQSEFVCISPPTPVGESQAALRVFSGVRPLFVDGRNETTEYSEERYPGVHHPSMQILGMTGHLHAFTRLVETSPGQIFRFDCFVELAASGPPPTMINPRAERYIDQCRAFMENVSVTDR